MSLGTSLATFGTLALCLPSVFSIPPYTQSHHPYLTNHFIQKHLLYRFVVDPNQSQPRILSPWYTSLTCLFHHSNFHHFLSNAYSIVTSSYFLNLGFWQTLILLYGGSWFGVLVHTIEWSVFRNPYYGLVKTKTQEDVEGMTSTVIGWLKQNLSLESSEPIRRVEDTVNHLAKFVPNIPRTFVVCGSSAGAFALIGADLYGLIDSLFSTWHGIRTSKKNFKNPEMDRHRKEAMLTELFYISTNLVIKVISITSQIIAMSQDLAQPAFLFDVRSIMDISSSPQIAYSAHLGGFVFGFFVKMLLLPSS